LKEIDNHNPQTNQNKQTNKQTSFTDSFFFIFDNTYLFSIEFGNTVPNIYIINTIHSYHNILQNAKTKASIIITKIVC